MWQSVCCNCLTSYLPDLDAWTTIPISARAGKQRRRRLILKLPAFSKLRFLCHFRLALLAILMVREIPAYVAPQVTPTAQRRHGRRENCAPTPHRMCIFVVPFGLLLVSPEAGERLRRVREAATGELLLRSPSRCTRAPNWLDVSSAMNIMGK